MLNIMKKLADWLVEHEEKMADDCKVPDEVIEEWEETVDERLKRMEENHKTNSAQYEMLKDIKERIEEIKAKRAKECKITPKGN